MESTSNSFLLLGGLLLAARVFGEGAVRAGMPSVLGIILAGLVAGPALLGVVGAGGDQFTTSAGQIGVVILMFIAGLETHPGELRSVGRTAIAVAVAGVIVPFVAGYVVGAAAGMETMHALFLGAILTATSVSITAETLRELGRTRSREGSIIMGAAIIDDILGVLLLSGLVVAESGGSIGRPVVEMLAFSALAFAFARWVMPLVVEHHDRFDSSDTHVTLGLAMALGFAWLAVHLGGLADVTGAFLAGVMLSRTELGHKMLDPVSRLGYALFIPLFFIVIGAEVTREDLTAAPLLCLALVAVAIATKFGACAFAALVCGEHRSTSMRVGAGMVGRGEIALVVASVGLREGVVDGRVFSIAVVITLATTIAAPLLLKASYAFAARPGAVHDIGRAPTGASPEWAAAGD